MKKPINYLASSVEQLSNYDFPHQKKLFELYQLTQRIREIWQATLPLTVLETLAVIYYDQYTLSISTNNHTVANYLLYNRQSLLASLQQNEPKFHSVTLLKFRVIVLEKAQQQLQCNQKVTNVKKCELSEATQRNISQLLNIVTEDEQLREVLQKFI